MIRQKVYQLEQAQIKMKAEYVAISSRCPAHIIVAFANIPCSCQLRNRDPHVATRARIARRATCRLSPPSCAAYGSSGATAIARSRPQQLVWWYYGKPRR